MNYKLLLLTTLILTNIHAQDTWEQITGNGFGLSNQNTVPEMEVFKNKIFVTTASTSFGLAKIWHSNTGDIGDWSDSAVFVPPLQGDISFHSFGTTTLDNGYMWMGTGSGYGSAIYRTEDGYLWTQISERGFGNDSLTGAAPNMVVFQGSLDSSPYLYVGMGSHGEGKPGQVWRTPYLNTDSTLSQWTKLVDFADIDSNVQTITYFEVWNGKIYFGTDDGGQLWESIDGTNFSKNTNLESASGYGSNKVIASIEVFNNELYITTNNPMQGGHIWKTSDGSNWNSITTNAFGDGSDSFELRSLRESKGELWVTAYTDIASSQGTPIWRSSDGTNWTQSNSYGFGNSDNNGQNAVTIGFGEYQYFGGPNYISGGQIWRTQTSLDLDYLNTCITRVVPNPIEGISFSISNSCLKTGVCRIYNIQGQLVSELKFNNGSINHESNGLELPGLYFYMITTIDGKSITGKFTKL